MTIGTIVIGTKDWHETISEIFFEIESLVGVLGMLVLLGIGFFVVGHLHKF
jgi:hypothetical protein